MEHVLESEQIVPRPRSEVFAFFSRPENLQALTPTFMRFEILTPSPIPMAVGTLIDYRIRLFGLPMRWRTRIEAFEPETRFIDVQLQGPYRRWHHTHTFEDVDGGTRIRDRVLYDVGFGPFGAVARTLFVRRTLTRIFDFRRTEIAARFGVAPEPSSSVRASAPSPR